MSEIIGMILLVFLLIFLALSAGIVAKFIKKTQDILREYKEKGKHEISKKEFIMYLIIYIVIIIIYGSTVIWLLIAFLKVTHFFW